MYSHGAVVYLLEDFSFVLHLIAVTNESQASLQVCCAKNQNC